MTNRRSFFKLLGLTAGAVAAAPSASVAAVTTALPPIPTVKAKAAYVTTLACSDDWQEVKHSLNSLLICAAAGDAKGNRVHVDIEAVGMNSCRVRVQKPPRTFTGWFTKNRDSGLRRLIVYIPNIDGIKALTHTQHASVNKPRTLRLRAD